MLANILCVVAYLVITGLLLYAYEMLKESRCVQIVILVIGVLMLSQCLTAPVRFSAKCWMVIIFVSGVIWIALKTRARKSDWGHRLRAIDRMIARFAKQLEFVDAIHEVKDYELQLFGGDEEEKRYVMATKLCARWYRRRIIWLRCLKLCPFLAER